MTQIVKHHFSRIGVTCGQSSALVGGCHLLREVVLIASRGGPNQSAGLAVFASKVGSNQFAWPRRSPKAHRRKTLRRSRGTPMGVMRDQLSIDAPSDFCVETAVRLTVSRLGATIRHRNAGEGE